MAAIIMEVATLRQHDMMAVLRHPLLPIRVIVNTTAMQLIMHKTITNMVTPHEIANPFQTKITAQHI
jgi:hypothetical protein